MHNPVNVPKSAEFVSSPPLSPYDRLLQTRFVLSYIPDIDESVPDDYVDTDQVWMGYMGEHGPGGDGIYGWVGNTWVDTDQVGMEYRG